MFDLTPSRILKIAGLLVCLAITQESRAEFFIVIGSKDGIDKSTSLTYSIGQVATLGVYAYNTSATTDISLSSTSLAFDISRPYSLNAFDGHNQFVEDSFQNFAFSFLGFTDNGSGIQGPGSGLSGASNAANQFDLLLEFNPANSGRPLIPKGGSILNAVHLANVSFEVTASAQEDVVYGFRFNRDAWFDDQGGSANENTQNLDLIAGADGAFYNRFTITAVPEPSSLALVGLVSVGMCFARRRQRASV